jgi:protein-S-isoprenylcysteine O-methyltransferase Ste14
VPEDRRRKEVLRKELEKTGNWLFRWRSYLPLTLTGIILLAMRHFHYLGHSHAVDQVWEAVCLIISFFGLGIRIHTIGHAPPGTSGRNTRRQVAAALNTTGMYSVVRHPLYLGNFFIWLGISMFLHIWWVSLIFILVFWLYYERIMYAEEEFLSREFGKEFEEWASRTPAFWPAVKNWKRPARPFSWRRVLRSEYSGLFAIIASFTLIEIVGDMVVEGKLEFDPMWIIIFTSGLGIYLLLRTLKKTGVLRVRKR